jgi:hypothetical protein
VVRQSGLLADIEEFVEGTGHNMTAHCRVLRADTSEEIQQRFSWGEAEQAGLTSKGGPWQDYPRRMLQMRARSWCLRDAFPEVLKGMMLAEEAEAIPESNGQSLDPRDEMSRPRSDEWYRKAIEWMVEKGASWDELTEFAGRIPKGDHKLKDWPDAKWDAAKQRVQQAQADREAHAAEKAAAESGKAQAEGGDTTPSHTDDTANGRVDQSDADTEAHAAEKTYEHAQEALNAHFDAAWKTDQNEGWEPISENQLNRLYAIADDNDWSDAALNRLVKDELGWESKADLPYGDPYDEVVASLEDERLRYHMSRDPDTPDMFDEDGSDETEANDEAFEDGAEDDDLPF